MKQSKFPAGWDEQRVRRVLKHYEQQTDGAAVAEDEAAVAEDEAAFEDSSKTVMEVPKDLVLTVRELIAKHKRSRRA